MSSSSEVITLDYDIVPWSDLFPELQVEPIDNLQMVGCLELLRKIADYMTLWSYLKLCSQQSGGGDADLSELSDGEAVLVKDLIRLNGAISNAVMGSGHLDATASGLDRDFRLSKGADLIALSDYLAGRIKASAIYRSDWYGIVRLLERAGLISPTGCLVGVLHEPGSELSVLHGTEQAFMGPVEPSRDFSMAVHAQVKRPIGRKFVRTPRGGTYGKQLAALLADGHGPDVFTALPIVTNATSVHYEQPDHATLPPRKESETWLDTLKVLPSAVIRDLLVIAPDQSPVNGNPEQGTKPKRCELFLRVEKDVISNKKSPFKYHGYEIKSKSEGYIEGNDVCLFPDHYDPSKYPKALPYLLPLNDGVTQPLEASFGKGSRIQPAFARFYDSGDAYVKALERIVYGQG